MKKPTEHSPRISRIARMSCFSRVLLAYNNPDVMKAVFSPNLLIPCSLRRTRAFKLPSRTFAAAPRGELVYKWPVVSGQWPVKCGDAPRIWSAAACRRFRAPQPTYPVVLSRLRPRGALISSTSDSRPATRVRPAGRALKGRESIAQGNALHNVPLESSRLKALHPAVGRTNHWPLTTDHFIHMMAPLQGACFFVGGLRRALPYATDSLPFRAPPQFTSHVLSRQRRAAR